MNSRQAWFGGVGRGSNLNVGHRGTSSVPRRCAIVFQDCWPGLLAMSTRGLIDKASQTSHRGLDVRELCVDI